jgi:hypothetical protein
MTYGTTPFNARPGMATDPNQPAGSGNLGGTGFSEAANNRRLELQTRFTF